MTITASVRDTHAQRDGERQREGMALRLARRRQDVTPVIRRHTAFSHGGLVNNGNTVHGNIGIRDGARITT